MLGCDRKMKRSGLDLSPSSAEMGLHKKQSKAIFLIFANTRQIIVVCKARGKAV